MTTASRLAAATLVTLGVLATAACRTTSVTCTSGSCRIGFGGGKGSTTLSGNQMGSARQSMPFPWGGTDNGVASLLLDTDRGSCTQGQTVTLGVSP